jgi:hypothetical protein
MKLSRSTLELIGAGLLLVLIAISFWTPAQAQLGNSGVPVHCNAIVLSMTPQTLSCSAADGTAFVNNRVPAGYYLMVTDVIIVPSSSADVIADIEADDASNAYASDVAVQTNSFASQGQHFTTPALVLPAQYRLKATSLNGGGFLAQVFGLLTRNLTYMPLIVR